ncbi:MAG: alanine:cation symporter family protein [Alphaproteobacteria bacterium]|nr:alanine:cation symporter family protein [Alphaproteobacteria bacterium]
MEKLFEYVKLICLKLQYINDFFWEFPTNIEAYSSLPILGKLPFSIILLIYSGIYFSVALNFIQFKTINKAITILKERAPIKQGLSPLSSFLLSTAMRVGPGNIVGVSGAVSTGGPGALFWMWFSAFFGMATSFVEATLSQIFKIKKDDQYLGGFSYYGKSLFKNSAVIGIFLSCMYILYAYLVLPSQAFNTISSIGEISSIVQGAQIESNSTIYKISSILLIIVLTIFTFGGIKFIAKQTNRLVPFMAITYILTVTIIIYLNFERIPWFFYSVFTEAFKPEAIFGGSFGIVISNGIKRGLMSNEAGQGTVTMAAATAETKHPCDQGYVQAFGVFIDTIIICSLTGFILVMARIWQTDMASQWFSLGKLSRFTASVNELLPNTSIHFIVNIIISICFGLFAFTTLIGLISFAEICANLISKKLFFINSIRIISILLIAFGLICNLAGLDLSTLWNLGDLANILLIYTNIPLLYVGFKYVKKAKKHYDENNQKCFNSKVIGIETSTWNE